MTAPPAAWRRDGRDWPNGAASRFIAAAGMVWHVQVMGSGPAVLLAHGTGAATHSWRDLAPLLARRMTVVAPDLPGHGFTAAPPRAALSLPFMAQTLAELCRTLGIAPALAVGHSAGAAVLARMCLDAAIAPHGLVALNGALLPLYGLPGRVFSPLAKLIVRLPGVPDLFAWRAGDRRMVERLLRDTGSTLDARGVDLYARLAGRPDHARAALTMMAAWDLDPLLRDLPRLRQPLLLIAGANDRTIAPAESERVRALVPDRRIRILPRLGHLAHEEAPAATAAAVLEFAQDCGALAD